MRIFEPISALSNKISRLSYFGGGITAPQNLHRTLTWRLLRGTCWSFLHVGHVRLVRKVLHITPVKMGFIGSSLFGSFIWSPKKCAIETHKGLDFLAVVFQ